MFQPTATNLRHVPTSWPQRAPCKTFAASSRCTWCRAVRCRRSTSAVHFYMRQAAAKPARQQRKLAWRRSACSWSFGGDICCNDCRFVFVSVAAPSSSSSCHAHGGEPARTTGVGGGWRGEVGRSEWGLEGGEENRTKAIAETAMAKAGRGREGGGGEGAAWHAVRDGSTLRPPPTKSRTKPRTGPTGWPKRRASATTAGRCRHTG